MRRSVAGKYTCRYCPKSYRLRPLVGINPRPARPRDTMRTECIDAYARAPVDELCGALCRGAQVVGRPRGGAPPPMVGVHRHCHGGWKGGNAAAAACVFFPSLFRLLYRYILQVYYNVGRYIRRVLPAPRRNRSPFLVGVAHAAATAALH